MLNSHSGAELSGPAHDAGLDCAHQQQLLLHSGAVTRYNISSCAVLAGMNLPLENTTPRARAILSHPIYPAGNTSQVVGFVTAVILYDVILMGHLPTDVSSIRYVVRSDDVILTYDILNGVPVFLDVGDLHDSEFDSYAQQIDIITVIGSGAISMPKIYTLTFYPTDQYRDSFFDSNQRWVFCFGSVAIVMGISILFGVYDYFIERASSEQQAVLETKRQFVRFISHEVRTPLNAVAMGGNLMQEQVRFMWLSVVAFIYGLCVVMVPSIAIMWLCIDSEKI